MSATTMSPKGDDPQARMRKAIVAIMLDTTLSEQEKALKRQALLSGKWAPGGCATDGMPEERQGSREAGPLAP